MIKAGGAGQLSSAVQPWSLQDKLHDNVEEAKGSETKRKEITASGKVCRISALSRH